MALGWAAFGLIVLTALLSARNNAGLEWLWPVVGVASVIPLFIVARAWRLSWWIHAVGAAIPVSVLVVGLAADGGWFGAARATRYGWGVLAAIALMAWATTPKRRIVAASGVIVLALDQYVTAWFPWWGGGDPSRLMTGTFGWHNQLAAYCLIGAAVAMVLAMLANRMVVLLAMLGVALSTAGVVASGSRSTLALLVVVAVVGLAVAVVTRGLRGLGRWAVTCALAVGTTFFMASVVFFPRVAEAAPFDAVVARGSGSSSWIARLDHWRVALEMGAEYWLTGSGLATYGLRSQCFDRQYYTSNPHNEWLLAWSEGGLIMLLPMLAVLAGAGAIAVRSARPFPGPARLLADPGRWAALLGLTMALGHVAFDFDWAYPALVVMAALVAGIAGAPVVSRRRRGTTRHLGALLAASAIVAASLAGFALDPLPHESLQNGDLQGAAASAPCA
ncbi:MAG TPA: O-antigen ligase family protein [Microcella sp.]|nr:O-antigen ligase family protein [Microcella sp.]